VRRGETLASIARGHGTSVEQLVVWNDIRDPDLIWVGQELTLGGGSVATPTPSGQALSHVVRRGETLALIARMYGVSVGDLVAWNEVRDLDLISAGQRLVVGAPPTPVTTATPVLTATPPVTPIPSPLQAPIRTVKPTAAEPMSSAELEYVRQVAALGEDLLRNSATVIARMHDALRQPSLLADEMWGLQTAVALGGLELDRKSLHSLRAPQRFKSIHGEFLEATQLVDDAADLVPMPLDRLRSSRIEEITTAMNEGRTAVSRAARQIEDMVATLERR